jgi:hypothetical protein
MADEITQKLRDLVEYVGSYTDIANANGPRVVRKTNPTLNQTTTIVASSTEPTSLILPLNVLWINFDNTGSYYKKVFRRDSKSPDPEGIFTQSWIEVTQYEDLWDAQYWDPLDDILPTTGEAGTGNLGIVRLTVAPTNPEDPIVITEGDDTLTNSRDPLPHDEMHSEIPATRLATTGDAVVISSGSPATNAGMIADFQGNSSWGTVTSNHIYPNVTELATAQILDPSALNIPPLSGDIILRGQANSGSTLYGANFSYTLPVGTSLPLVMPVWAENAMSETVFSGWFVPTQITVISGAANVVGNTVTFNTPGPVVLQASIVDTDSTRTVTVQREYLVEEA